MFDRYVKSFKEQKESEGSDEIKVVDEGKYLCVLEEVKCDLTKDEARFTCVYKIMSGESVNTEFRGRLLFKNYAVTEKGAVWFMKDLEEMGLDLSGAKDAQDLHKKMVGLVGSEAMVYTKPREYNGKLYNNCYLNSFKASNGVKNYAPKPQDLDMDEDIPF